MEICWLAEDVSEVELFGYFQRWMEAAEMKVWLKVIWEKGRTARAFTVARRIGFGYG